MPDQKITDLTALTGANAATGDLVEVVDVNDTTMAASGTNKKMTLGNLAAAVAKEGVVAADAIFDAKGDLAAGTGANTAAKLTVGSNGTVLVAASGESTGMKWAAPAYPTLFGNGVDGDVTISADTTLTEDKYYRNLTVDSGKVLNPGGFRIFVSETLTLNGTIARNGASAVATQNGAGALGTGTLGGSVGGAAGNSASGSAPAGNTNVTGGSGGNGGGGGSGASNFLSAANGGVNFFCSLAAAHAIYTTPRGGGGGGGGGGSSSQNGGGGGAGGGVVLIAARTLAGTGTVEAKGGNGSDAIGPSASCGGGGGGGGGTIAIYSASTSNPWTLTVSGGTGGAPTGGGSSGTSGATGRTVTVLGVVL